jgi:hypothetical protein
MSARTITHHRPASRTVSDALVTLLCDRHAAALYRLARILVGDPDLAEHIVVDVLAAAVQARANTPRRFAEHRFALVDAVYRRCTGMQTSVEPLDEDQRAAIGYLVLDTRDVDSTRPTGALPIVRGSKQHHALNER